MWHTSFGDRTLKGAEAALVKAAVTAVAEHIQEESAGFDDSWGYGVQLFDELTWTQRLMLLDSVATYLLTETPATLELTAVNEAVVGVLFECVRMQIDLEILSIEDPELDYYWRTLVLTALREPVPDEEEEPLDPGSDYLPQDVRCDDHGKWRDAIELLADRILWDRDYEMAGTFLDQPPEKAERLKVYLGIDDDYFSSVAPDAISNATLEATYRRLGVMQ